MDFRTYLELETALSRRLVKAWREKADPVYAAIQDAVKAGDWDKARSLVDQLDLSSVGQDNREWIRAMLGSIATWGASNVATDPKFIISGDNGDTLDRVVDLTLAYLKHNGTTQVRDEALQSIAKAQGPVKKSGDDWKRDAWSNCVGTGFAVDELKHGFEAIEKHLKFVAEKELGSFKYDVEPYFAISKNDKWKVTSALQKAIRRGDVQQAQKMAAAAVKLDSYYAWRRMGTFAMEDVGMGDLNAAALALCVSSDMAMRKKHGEEKVACYVVSHLAEATKDRLNDDVLCLGGYALKLDQYKGMSESLDAYSKQELAVATKSEIASYMLRSMAIQKLYSRCKEDKDWTEFNRLTVDLPVLAQYVTLKGSYKGIHDLASSFPLTASLAVKSGPVAIEEVQFENLHKMEDLPEYALDKYTQTGRFSLLYFAKANAEARKFFDEKPVIRKGEALGFALFGIEGCKLNRRVVWDCTAGIEQKVDELEYVIAGLPLQDGRELEKILLSDPMMLRKARKRVSEREKEDYLKKHPESAQMELSFKKEYSYRSTQVSIPEDSEMGKALSDARNQIADEDLMGDGKDIGGNHVTLRYGLKSTDDADIKDYLAAQKAFPIKLGKITVFEPSEHSDGACPIVVDVISPDMERMNEDLGGIGDWKIADFEYHPHATLAYVKSEAAEKYKSLTVESKPFLVSEVEISNRGGSKKAVSLKVQKFNPYHDAEGKFTEESSAVGYVFHGTNEQNLDKISKEGLKPGSLNPHVYFTDNEDKARSYAFGKEDQKVTLRVDKSKVPDFEAVGEHNVRTPKIVAPEDLEYRYADGEWTPFKDTVEKADDSYIKPLVSFADGGDDQLQLIASLNMSRMASWGFVAEADVRGITEYTISKLQDGRVCKFCRMMEEKQPVFRVEDARGLVNRALSVTDPNDLATIQPWPDQDADSIASYKGMDSDAMVAEGLQIPPYHPFCRHYLVPVSAGAAPEEASTEQPLPTYTATAQTFKEIGAEVSSQDVDKWNAAVGLNPVDVLSAVSGAEAPEILEQKLKSLISFEKNGEISIESELADNAGKTAFSIDPLTGRMYVDSIELNPTEASNEGESLYDVLSSMVDVGISSGSGSLAVQASEYSATALGKMGFTPTPLKWQTIRMDAQDELNGGLRDAYKKLSPDAQVTVTSLLGSNDENSFSVLCQLPLELDGKPIAEALFGDVKGQFNLNLNDADAVAQAKAYLESK